MMTSASTTMTAMPSATRIGLGVRASRSGMLEPTGRPLERQRMPAPGAGTVPRKYTLSGGSVEEFPDLGGERGGGERLGQELDAVGDLALARDGLLRVAADVQHAHLRPERARLLDQLVAAHPGHHDVRQQQVDRAGLLAQNGERGEPVTRLQHSIAAPP